MAVVKVRFRCQRAQDEADPFYLTWALGDVTADDQGGAEAFTAVHTGILAWQAERTSQLWLNSSIDLVEVFEATGGPAFFVQGISPATTLGSGTASPHLLQIAVNEYVSSPRGPQALGRLNVVPPAGTTTAAALVSTQHRDEALDLMLAVHASIEAALLTPLVITGGGTGASEIIAYGADRRWDILKSRRVPDPNPPTIVFPGDP